MSDTGITVIQTGIYFGQIYAPVRHRHKCDTKNIHVRHRHKCDTDRHPPDRLTALSDTHA